METKFTKGEWIVEDRTNPINVTCGKKGFVITQVTNTQISHFLGNEQEAKANAKLIAAAPKILMELANAVVTIQKLLSLLSLDDNAKAIYQREIYKHEQVIREATE
jgi:hypothetical protein